MGYRWLGLVVIAALAPSVLVKPGPVSAASATAFAIDADVSARGSLERVGFYHHHRTQSFYCYPKNYWWFYRPYTTAPAGYARCMPYFHYLEPGGRDARRTIK
jgi:hypothetical protein